MSSSPDKDELERAERLFHEALDADDQSYAHGYEADWVDGSALGVVEALLKAGWTPPPDAT